jgi:hypothetical protein
VSESAEQMRGDEKLFRAIGAGISAGLATYVIAFWGNACTDSSEDIKLVAIVLVCPLTAVVFSLPRFSLGSYWRKGLAAGLGSSSV